MGLIYREYGKTIEITTFERSPSKVRVYSPRKRLDAVRVRRADSLSRTKQICLRRVSSAIKKLGCPLFITLTFSGDASDAFYSQKELGLFQVRLRRRFAGCHSVFIPEVSGAGRIHWHGLLFGLPLHFGDRRQGKHIISYGTERSTRILQSVWGNGWVDVLATDGDERLAGYLAKYITKGNHDMFNAMHLLRISQDFPRDFKAVDEYADYFIDLMPDGLLPKREWSVDNDYLGTVTKKWFY